VWQKAHQFTLSVYTLSRHFPKEEVYSLTSQFRRAAVSVAANIAEGYARRGKADKIKFLNYAQGSLQECKYYVLLSRDLNYGSDADMDAKIEEVSKLLAAYIRGIERRRASFLHSALYFLLSLFS
jgi:four helix bundle protein